LTSCNRAIANTTNVKDELDMSVDGETETYIIRDMKTLGIQIVPQGHTFLSGDCPEVTLKISLVDDPAMFVPYDCFKLCEGCETKYWNIAHASFKFMKVCYTKNAATNGTLCIIASGKKQ